jgi:hypothetical protein
VAPKTHNQGAPAQRGAERRAAVRYPLVQECLVRPRGASLPGAGDWHGIAYNLSATGVGIALPYRLRLGAELTVEAWGRDAPLLRARVVRVRPAGSLWFHGCALAAALAAADLRAWLPGGGTP